MSDSKDILISGGYGEVGRRLAAHLGPAYPGRIIVAGRDTRKAAALAEELGAGARSRRVDIHDAASVEAALSGVALVVNCVDQREPHLLRGAVEGGLAYTDVSASLIWRTAIAMRTDAEQHGARIVIGAGLVPGISSMMARAATERLGQAEGVHVGLLLSIGDAFGPAALEYLLSEISRPFVVTEQGSRRTVYAFTEGRAINFPAPLGRRWVYRAPFADQFLYPQTLGVRTAAARLALNPPWITTVVITLLRIGVGALLAHGGVRRAIIRSVGELHKAYRGSNEFAVVVEAEGQGAGTQLSLSGRDQSEATAIGAALIARALYDGEVSRAGVWCAEEVIAPAPFFDALAQHGLRVTADA